MRERRFRSNQAELKLIPAGDFHETEGGDGHGTETAAYYRREGRHRDSGFEAHLRFTGNINARRAFGEDIRCSKCNKLESSTLEFEQWNFLFYCAN